MENQTTKSTTTKSTTTKSTTTKSTTFENLQETAKVLSEKNTWIRKGLENFMKIWEEKTVCGETIRSSTVLYITYNDGYIPDRDFFLSAGCKDLKSDEGRDISENSYYYDYLSIPKLRKIIKLIPQAIAEISEKMKQNIEENENIIAWIESITKQEI